ncbi:MAG: hypothetical protein HN368_05290 [Spirochaetales bacterium]|jgi:hypothetical protein|nr:hypothetical protein [Spirochaetales bacterium]
MSKLPYIPYTVTENPWDPDELGNHRAVIHVAASADVVRVVVPWRRRDSNPSDKGVILKSIGGTKIEHCHAENIANESGTFVFEPADGPGVYYIYFMPYTGTVKKPYPQIDYLPVIEGTDSWFQQVTSNPSASYDEAALKALECVDEFNKFTEMELIAAKDELSAFVSTAGDKRFLSILEDRKNPIRMTDMIPFRWTQRESRIELADNAKQGEYYVFQVGVYAFDHDLPDLSIQFQDMVSGTSGIGVPKESFTCFNTAGVGWNGTEFTKAISVPPGFVQALWCGIDIPVELPAGEYQAIVTIITGSSEEQLTLSLNVESRIIDNHGDNDSWRLSRLRWLNSKDGTEDTVPPPFAPIEVDDKTVSILGRDLTLTETGLPEQIYSRFTDDMRRTDGAPVSLLAGPAAFKIAAADGREEVFQAESINVEAGNSYASWTSVSAAGDLTMQLKGQLDFDGNTEYEVKISAVKSVKLKDISLEIPMSGEMARYMTGLGREGGTIPDDFLWAWDVRKNQDAVWIGAVHGGIQVTLKDENYSRPLNTNFYHLKPLVMPSSWCNDGKGSIVMRRTDKAYILSCRGGERVMQANESLYFNLRLMITPFKPLDTHRHFSSRYCHAYRPIDEVDEMGANLINIHHATDINPYINYPFLTPEVLKRYVDEAHEKDKQVKLYYTVREITTRTPELFALHSLGGEILVDGEGGGHAWLQEHMGRNYIAAWYALQVRDTSVINGVLSRWHNFYVKGLDWLAKNIEIDGVYIDDLGFGREVMQRVRRVLHRHRGDPVMDLHSANQFNEKDGFASSTNLYLEHFPYFDRLWFGEYFNYDAKPDYWLVEMSGIPFGLMGEMLQDGGNPWRGMIFGMTGRMPRVTMNTGLWKAWDKYELPSASMTGFWCKSSPVTSSSSDIPATLYHGKKYTIIALASWAEKETIVDLGIDWQALGYDEAAAQVFVPEIPEYQTSEDDVDTHAVAVEPGKGKLIVIKAPA